MKPQFHIITIIKFFAIWSACAQPVPEKTFPAEALARDLAFVRTSVEALHPGLDRFNQQKEFLAACDSVQAVLKKSDALTLKSYFRLVNPLLVKLRCGHTKFFPPMKGFPFYFHTDQLLPVIVRLDGEGRLLIVKSTTENLRGKYLERINGKPVEQIMAALKDNMFVDGHVQSSADAQIEQYFSAWYADFIQDGPALTADLTNEKGDQETVQLAGINVTQWQELNQNSSYLLRGNQLQIRDDSIALLRIATFYSEKGNKQFLRFLDSSFTAIRQRNIRHLIIDVRGNEGGNDALGKELYRYIALQDFRYYDRIEVKAKRKKDIPNYRNAYFPKFIGLARLVIKKDKQGRLLFTRHQNLGTHHPHKQAYTGKVWFLEDGLSYSVTSEFLAVAKSEDRGIFVGKESGGTYEGDNSGTFVIFKLPATSLDLGIPVGGYYSAVKPAQQPARGIMPDFQVNFSREDLLQNLDPGMELVIGKISAASRPL